MLLFEYIFGSFGFQEGLRIIIVYLVKQILLPLIHLLKKNYFSIYPTLHIAYELSELEKLQLIYSRRVRRPESDDINLFPEYSYLRNVRAGEILNLLPEYIHSLELGLSYQNHQYSILPSLYYRYTSNRFTRLTNLINDTTTLTTEENLSHDQSAGFKFIPSANAGKIFTTNISRDEVKSQIEGSNLGYSFRKSV